MADLLSALVQRSKQVADPRAAAYASGNRPYMVTLVRPGVAATYNRATKAMTNPVDVLLYTGPARFTVLAGPVEVEVGDERTTLSSATISIDAYNGSAPRVDDIVAVLVSAQSTATHMSGRQFTVTGVEAGGHFGIGYIMSALGVAASRRT